MHVIDKLTCDVTKLHIEYGNRELYYILHQRYSFDPYYVWGI